MRFPWYEAVAAGARLDQGEIILRCPVVSWKDNPVDVDSINPADKDKIKEVLTAACEIVEQDVIIMTQACDMADLNSHQHITLCAHRPLNEFKESWIATLKSPSENTSKNWKSTMEKIRKAEVNSLCVLNREDGQAFDKDHQMNRGDRANYDAPHRVVDFTSVFTLPRLFLDSWVQQQSSRLKLMPPYREHVAQAFARFYMRVGTPTDVHKDWMPS